MPSDRNAAGLLILLFLAACATFQPPALFDDGPLRERAITKVTEDIRVSAALPTADEAKSIFGIDLPARHTQAVWLEIEKKTLIKISIATSSRANRKQTASAARARLV